MNHQTRNQTAWPKARALNDKAECDESEIQEDEGS
jgi:hypothetical protein